MSDSSTQQIALLDLRLVEIDLDTCQQKYVQIRIEDPKGQSLLIIRGNKNAKYHMDVALPITASLTKARLKCNVIGGGWISIDNNKNLDIYGYSVQYGPANHEETAECCKKELKEFNVTWSNDSC
eukprot:176473_1